jgi:hypothetical protein
MKRLLALAVGGILVGSLVAAASAAPVGTSDNVKRPQGLKNLKKVAQSKLVREKKLQQVRKQGAAMRQLTQNAK